MIKKRLGMLVKDGYTNGKDRKFERKSSWNYIMNSFLPAFSVLFFLSCLVAFMVSFYTPFFSSIGVVLLILWVLSLGYFVYPKIAKVRKVSNKVEYENKRYLYLLYPIYVVWVAMVRGLGAIWGWIRLGIFTISGYGIRSEEKKRKAVPY
jgi:hypothetical protein